MISTLKWVGALAPPILFVAYPLLSLFEQNQTDLPLSVVWTPLASVLAATAVLFAVFALVFKRAPKAGVLTSLAVLAFFYWGTVKSDASGLHISDGLLLALWLALLVAAAVLVVRTRRSLTTLTLGLGLAAAVLTLVPAVRIATYQANHPAVSTSDPRLWSAALPQPAQPASARRPDIYVVIPDDYARTDVLSKYFHFDNSAFVGQLKQRGFVVSPQARSPYSDSESNIAAELNMDYLNGLAKILGPKSQDVRPVKTLIENNRASRLLKPLGYRYVHLDTDEVTFAGGNPDISSVATPDSFTSLWLRKSVLRLIGGPFGFNDHAAGDRYRDGIRSALSRLRAVPGGPSPKFVVFHTLLPHDPYVYGAGGQAVTFPGHSDSDLASSLGRAYYLRQLQYLSRKLLETIDTIKARSKTPPVIVVQSDEGFQANDTPFGVAAMRDIRVKGFTALYMPGVAKPRVPQPANTVNTLRLVFNQYFGTHYPMLRSASYPELDFPYQYQEMRVAK